MSNGTKRAQLSNRQMVGLTDYQDAALKEMAQAEGCSVSDLIRRAVMQQFHLPLSAPKESKQGQNGATSTKSQPQKAVA